MKTLTTALAGSVVLFILLRCYAGARQPKSAGFDPFPSVTAIDPHHRIAILGDTQRTLRAERIIGREQNDAERELLLNLLAKTRPDHLILLGDMVNQGSSKDEWDYFDKIMDPIRRLSIPLSALFGNHDYWGPREQARANAEARFPKLRKNPQSVMSFGPVRFILLDSNESDMGHEAWISQRSWYDATLREMERDLSVKGVVVLTHHPPFTNSKTTGDEKHVQDAFLLSYLSCKKTLAFISGHAHTFEHFIKNEKTFLVSGGGGGPRVFLLQGKNRRHADIHVGSSPRPFHFLVANLENDALAFKVMGFDKGETSLREIDQLSLKFSKN